MNDNNMIVYLYIPIEIIKMGVISSQWIILIIFNNRFFTMLKST
jgi:hypothetical protein